ncbi:hypothetical protein PJN27_28530, partial [Mycobacterium kansasii]
MTALKLTAERKHMERMRDRKYHNMTLPRASRHMPERSMYRGSQEATFKYPKMFRDNKITWFFITCV